jgi:hypothetical protein
MRKVLVSVFLITCPLLTKGQGNKLVGKLQKESIEWNDGKLFLKNGNTLKGKVQYNDKIGTLALKTEEDSKSYSANTVVKFIFFDKAINERRDFISLDYPLEDLKRGIVSSYSLADAKNQVIVPTFFEVLKETNEFVILSKMRPIEYKEKTQRIGVAGDVIGSVNIVSDEVKQSEILFFLNPEGEIRPYVEFKNKETINVTFGNQRKSTKKKRIDSDLLEEFTGELYPVLMEYAKVNNLKTNRREDILKIIDHYIFLKSERTK